MAVFNPEVPNDIAKEYTGASGGVIKNNTFGTALEGLGNTLDVAVKGVDYDNQDKIQKQLYQETDKLNKDWGIDDAVRSRSHSIAGGATPDGLIASERSLTVIGEAFKQGKVTDSHYWAQATAIIKGMRARYPGYRDEIDNMVTQILGVNPANALRQSLIGEWEAAARKASQGADEFEKWARQQPGDELPPDFWQRQASGNPYPKEQVYQFSQARSRDKSELSYNNSKLDNLTKQGTLDKQTATGEGYRSVDRLFDSLVVRSTAPMGLNYQQVAATIDEAIKQKGGPTPEQQDIIAKGLLQLERDWTQAVNTSLSNPWAPGSPNSFSSFLGDDVKKIQEYAATKIKSLQDIVRNGDFSLMKLNAAASSAKENFIYRQWVDSNDTVAKVKVARDKFGEVALNTHILTSGGQVLKDMQELFKTNSQIDMLNGKATFTDVMKQGKGLNLQTPDDVKMYTTIMDNSLALIGDKKVPLAAREAQVSAFFGPENAGLMKQFANTYQSQVGVWRKLASPAVTQSMIEIKKSNPSLWNQYSGWVLAQFPNMVQQHAVDAQKIIQGNFTPSEDILFDPGTNKFEYTAKPPVVSSSKNPFDLSVKPYDQQVAEYRTRGIAGTKVVDELNATLDVVKPIIEAEGGDTTSKILQLFRLSGVDPTAPKEKSGDPVGDFFSMIGKALSVTTPSANSADYTSKSKDQERLLGRSDKKD